MWLNKITYLKKIQALKWFSLYNILSSLFVGLWCQFVALCTSHLHQHRLESVG